MAYETAVAEPHQDAATHVGTAFDGVRAAARETVLRGPGPHHLAHFRGTVYDFDVDVLGDAGRDPAECRSRCRQAGRQLCGTFCAMDETLQAVATGALIRIVVHTDEGAFCCNSTVPGSFLVGVVFERLSEPAAALSAQPGVDACDKAVSGLVTTQRALLSLGSQNPGGFEHRPSRTSPGWTGPHRVQGFDPNGLVTSAFQDAIDPADLHFVALCVDGGIELTADCLGDERLSRFFTQIDVATRETFYQKFIGGLGLDASRFARTVAPVIGTRLLRLVLDVEQGAIYYYRLRSGAYLAGVTLDQARVQAADDKMSALTVACQRLLQPAYQDG